MKRLAIIMGLATSTAFCQTPSPSAQTPSLNSSYFSHIEGINGSGTGTFALGSGMRVCLTSAVVPILSGCSVGLSLAAAGVASLDTTTAGNGLGSLNLATLNATADIVAQVGTNPAPYTAMTPTVVAGGTATQNFTFSAVTGNVELSGLLGFPGTGTPDTGLSRDSPGVVDVGNGTAGNASGTINAANLTASTLTATHVVKAGTGGLLSNAGITDQGGLLTLAEPTIFSSSLPTLSACTGGSIIGGSQNAFHITGLGSATTCTATFPVNNSGVCTANAYNSGTSAGVLVGVNSNSASVTFTMTGATDINAICF